MADTRARIANSVDEKGSSSFSKVSGVTSTSVEWNVGGMPQASTVKDRAGNLPNSLSSFGRSRRRSDSTAFLRINFVVITAKLLAVRA